MSHATAPSFLLARLHGVSVMASLMLCLLVSLPAQAARLALVIGNDGYRQIEPLKNARNDARLMAATLKEAGFDVERVFENLDREAMYDALHIFASRIKKGDEVVFFYAGHGAQFGATPVLLPTDIKKDNEKKMEVNSVALSYVQAQFKEAGFSLLVIDACRDNPLDSADASGTRGLERSGLSMITLATGNAIIMSASRGQKALDYIPGNPRSANSLFTHELVQAIKTPGQDVHTALREVRERVEDKAKLAGNPQLPDMEDKTRGRFFFHHVSPPVADTKPLEDEAWALCKTGASSKPCGSYLEDYPQGRYAKLARTRMDDMQQASAAVIQRPPRDVKVDDAPNTSSSSAHMVSRPMGKRVALLVGNAAYQNSVVLKNTINDVRLIETSLKKLGFDVTRQDNATDREIRSGLANFEKRAKDAEVALVYLSGHGAMHGGADYFLPTDAPKIETAIELQTNSINVNAIVENMKSWKAALAVLAADNSRDQPFGTRGITQGLRRPIQDTIVLFSSQPGQVASDGDGITSPFASAFAAALDNQSLSVLGMLEDTRKAVVRKTGGKQVPVITTNMTEDVYLARPPVHTR